MILGEFIPILIQQFQLPETMSSTAVSPIPPSFIPKLALCRSSTDLKPVHAQFIKSGLIHDTLAAAELLKFICVSSRPDLKYANKLFEQLHEPNCFSWNTIIRAFAETRGGEDDDPLTAFLLFCQMCHDGSVAPNRFTFPSLLKACAKMGGIDKGKQVHGFVVKLGLNADEFVASSLVRMYVMCGVMEDARILFHKQVFELGDGSKSALDKRKQDGNVVLWNVMIDGYARLGELGVSRKLFGNMPHRSVVSWNVMISSYAQNGHFKEAIEMFREMQMGEICPNYVTLVSVLPAISQFGVLELGKWVHLYAGRNEIVIDSVLGSALIDMYSKCGSIEKAVQVFERIIDKKNTVTWSALIGGLAMHGQAKDALDYFWRMQHAGVAPSDVVYIGLLNACSHAGLVEDGRLVFNHMVNVVGLEPRIEHYGCLVDLLGRAGLLEEAEQVILNMPIKPDDVIWKALLGACKMHGNLEMGERIAKILMALFPNDRNWEGVAEMRLKMKEMDIRKDPGCSWIELDGIIHEFLVEDDSNPRSKEVHLMLAEISYKLRNAGYRPNTTQVLLNMDEEDKESALQYHSEKIAVAFGLISTAPRTPLRVVKNLRICEDCHSSMKLISKLYNRKIIVRDRKRFHHFVNGSCSCKDYW
ncbi:hypothetical protein K2173_010049 [Erythroxylum novogranatense]|uniref:DYW domain-containing protein n=1 Tax=Erythroxylum novogranatense TaxID=1862640 RepID=A0AAV8U948_9ROSI|nr:hypothetical protein K2173_010049 [Erythroxylum novogranatense]